MTEQSTDYSTLDTDQQDVVSQLRSSTPLDRLNIAEIDKVFVALDQLGWTLAKKAA